jgi:hypothetical protein
MTIYLNTNTGEYPRHQGDLELLGWVAGEPLPADWVEIKYVEPPICGIDEIVEQAAPTLVNDEWKMTWQARILTADEKAYRDAPKTAKAKLIELGLSEIEVQALIRGLIR